MDTAELSRRLENLIRIGTVVDVDNDAALCRIKTGNLTTDWLPWFALRAGDTRIWSAPTVGEQAMIFSPSGELAGGAVLVGLYRAAHPAPSASPVEHIADFPDGARIAYNHATGALTATGIKTALIQADTSVTIDTLHTRITGELTVEGLLTYNGGATGHGDHTHSGGDLSSNGKVLHTHTHGPDRKPA